MALADNAAKYTPAGTVIALGSARDAGGARLWVRDEGPGVAPADRERIFDRFARGSDGPRRSDGAGLGLSIVRVIARAHGGEVEVASLPGQGASFTLHLPVVDEQAPRPPDRDDPPADPSRTHRDDVETTRPLPVPESHR